MFHLPGNPDPAAAPLAPATAPPATSCRTAASVPPAVGRPPARGRAGARFGAVITDWGGVMTSPIAETVRAWLDADDIDHGHYAEIMRPWAVVASGAAAVNPVHALERGECTVTEFERALAARMVCRDGTPVAAEGLLARMFAATRPCDPMYGAIYAARRAGLRTGLLSNSWGLADYPRHLFPGMFDAVVISGEVGMRKPEERIFTYAARALGVAPGRCVFVDDLPGNVEAAEAVGMAGVLHRDPAGTVAALSALLGLPLAETPAPASG